jgi:type 1 glutamine amidotransferase
MPRLLKLAALLCVWSIAQFVIAADEGGSPAGDGKTKIVFVAGTPSHGYGDHEHRAGCLLLAKWLREGLPNVETAVHSNGWPEDAKIFDGARAIVAFSSGGRGNMMLGHLDQIDKLMKRGVGLACLHFTVEIPKGRAGDLLKDWIGGYYETFWSVNPTWKAQFKTLPHHPITRGVKPFAMTDEWYYHMRFMDGMEGVTAILSAVPPESTRQGPDGPYSGNPAVRARKGMAETVAWARERPDGGRGFGFTGLHFHWNLANRNFRTVLLNGIAWVAKIDVPPGGVPSQNPTLEELEANLDKPRPANFDRQRIEKMIEGWR